MRLLYALILVLHQYCNDLCLGITSWHGHGQNVNSQKIKINNYIQRSGEKGSIRIEPGQITV